MKMKRVISLLLALVLLTGNIPAAALAQEAAENLEVTEETEAAESAEATEVTEPAKETEATEATEPMESTGAEEAHEHAYDPLVTDPTCTEQGYTTYTCECGDSYVDDDTDATGEHIYENGICTCCGRKETQQLVKGFETVSSIRPGDSRLVDAFDTVSPLIYQDLTLFENCAITALNLFVTGTVVDNDGTNKNDPAIDEDTEYTFDVSVIDASSVKAGGYYSIKETYTISALGSELKKNDWNTFDVSHLGITVDEGETLGFGSSASTLEVFYLNKCVSTSLRYFGHKTTTGDTSLSLRKSYNLLVGVEGYPLAQKDPAPEEDHVHNFSNGVCTVCGFSKKPYQRLTYFTVDVADKSGNVYKDNAVLYLPATYSSDGKPVKLVIYCKQGASQITASSNPIEDVGFYNYLINLGYAVLGVDGVPDAWRDELGLCERAVGNPMAVQGTEKAYDYVIENYNIAADGCFISGYSQGGHYAQNVIDLTDIPILAAAEQSPVCSMQYHQWDLNAAVTVDGVKFTKGARLNVARIFAFPEVATNAELLNLSYNAALIDGYDPWVRNSKNVYTGFVQKSNLWHLPEGTSAEDITMTHTTKCPVKIWCAEDDTAISADVMKVFVKAIQNAGGIAEISVAESGGHGFFQKQTAVGTFVENGKAYHTLPIAVEIGDWFARHGGYEHKHTYENGSCITCGTAVLSLEGRTISILGASISTFGGTSNGAAADTTNSTIRNNAQYYPHAVVTDVGLNDTWWMQAAKDLGLRLLVNNSWSGSSLLHTRNGTAGAYVDRCVQLHDNTGDNAGEEPDIIGIQMGSNDFQYYKDTLGTADIDYDALITENEDGSFTYATPVTSLEAAAIVLHKISIRYPNAEMYYLNVSQRIDGTDAKSFNTELKKVVEHFGAHIVDIYGSVITPETFDTHIGDGRVHPNKLGMDAYTEAFKRALLDNTAYEVDTHTVSLNLDGVTADYGDDKIVISGDSYAVNLFAAANMGLDVTVIMDGKDITATAYANGTVTVSSVSDDVTITAKSVYEPKDYRWEFDGTDLTCVNGGNALTKKTGTTTNGVFNKTCYALANEVVLLHNLPWSVEWKSEGTFMNTNGSTGARIFTSDDVNAHYNARYIFKSNTRGIIAMGEKTNTGSHNYGIALADHGIDWTQLHTYRLENRIADDGSNMVWLFVDDKEIGPMNHYYVGTSDKKTTSDWLSGKDFLFPYMGTDTHGFTNAAIEYIAVWEGAHTHAYITAVTAPTCTERGYSTYTCECGDSYVDNYVDANGHNYAGIACNVCGEVHPNAANYKGKVISILGDSASTFAGYIPVDDGFNLAHRARYPQSNLLTDVNETWWMQVITAFGAKLGVNDSWAGSQVLNTLDTNSGDLGPDVAMASLTRIQNLGSNGTPDVILFYGAGNDIGRAVPLGSFNPDSAPQTVDLTAKKWNTFADAYVAAILRLKHFYPDSTVVVMLYQYIPDYFTNAELDEYNSLIQSVCDHYNIPTIDLRNSGVTPDMLPDNIHPNAEGMDLITQTVLDALMTDFSVEPGENVVYSITHELVNATASKHYYKGISAGREFSETITGEHIGITMGGVDITTNCYCNGTIAISNVTGDVVIKAKGNFNADGHLQQLPDVVCAGTNLWNALEPENIYYTVNGWGNVTAGTAWSITFPVQAGDRIWATSFGKSGENGDTANGVRITWFDENGVLATVDRNTVYKEFTANGHITTPEGALALNVTMASNNPNFKVYILSREHCYGDWKTTQEATASSEGQQRQVCAACGDIHTRKLIPVQLMASVEPGKVTAGTKPEDVKIGLSAGLAIGGVQVTDLELEYSITDKTGKVYSLEEALKTPGKYTITPKVKTP